MNATYLVTYDMTQFNAGAELLPTTLVPSSIIGWELFRVGSATPLAAQRIEAATTWAPGTYRFTWDGKYTAG